MFILGGVQMAHIGKKIKQRREELGLTQEELAHKLGYKSKSTVNKIEMGINDITQTKVVAFAKALSTTPSYLMGWTSNPNISPLKGEIIPIESVGIQCKTDDEKKLLLSYRSLTDISKKRVLSYCNGIAEIERADFELNASHKRTDIDIPENIDTSDNDIMDDENF